MLCSDAWLSLVERCVRDAEVAGSNPVASILGRGGPRSAFIAVWGFFFCETVLFSRPLHHKFSNVIIHCKYKC